MTCTEADLHNRDGYAFLFIPAGDRYLQFFPTKSDKHSVKDKQTLAFDSLFNNVKCFGPGLGGFMSGLFSPVFPSVLS